MIATHSAQRAAPTGAQAWFGLGLRSRVLISLGQLKVAFSRSRHVQAHSAKGAGAGAFPRERSLAGSCGRSCFPVCSHCCHFHSGTFPLSGFSAAGTWKQPHKGRQRGQGHPYPCLHSSESSQGSALMRIKAGTDMPVVMRSPLLDRATMLKLASKHPRKEHQSLQALSS